MKTDWQDPLSGEIISPDIAGLQEAVGKIEDALDLKVVNATNVPLTEIYISENDRYRIYQAAGKRNWVSNPAPVIKVNGTPVSSGFTINYGGGAVVFEPSLTVADVVTADFSYVTNVSNRLDAHLADNTKHLADGSQNLSVLADEEKIYKRISYNGGSLSANLIVGGKFTTSAKKLISLNRGNMILVSGMYDYDVGRTFSDILVAVSLGEVNVLQSAERGFVHSRTYMVDGASLMLAMEAGQYIVVAESIQHEVAILGG